MTRLAKNALNRHCLRCGHTWWPRQQKLSRQCPHCGARHWNVPPKKKLPPAK